MSVAFDVAPEYTRALDDVVEPSLEDRLLFGEERFIRRIVEGMPLTDRITHAYEADDALFQFVTEAFTRWFAPQRALFVRAWARREDSETSMEEAYRDFLEVIGLRRGARVSSEDDVWEEALDTQIEMAAEAFRCAIQQQDGWIEQYGVLPTRGSDGRYERRAYLQLVNTARGFLGVHGIRADTRSRLAAVDLEDVNGCVMPRHRDRALHDPVQEECQLAYQVGQEAQSIYREHLQTAAARAAERRAFGEALHAAQRRLDGSTLLGPHLVVAVRRCAEFLLELETRRPALLQERTRAATVDQRKSADERLEGLERQREDAREALTKARALLRLFQEAVRLGIIPTEDQEKPISLTQLVNRLV